jgi:hypothetical protein
MPSNIRIDTGIKRILINDGPDYLEFNPKDVIFAEKFYGLVAEFEAKLAEFKQRSNEIEAIVEVDSRGLPVNVTERLELIHEACVFIREKIDALFGANTSQKLFGGAMVLDVFPQFFDGIIPFIKEARGEKMDKYLPQHPNKVMK